MAGTIKGITIEFRGDTTRLDSALRKINTETKSIDSELKNVNRALKFNPTSVELWQQKQKLLNDKLKETNEKTKLLKETLQKVDSGEIEMSADDVAKLKRELIESESKAKALDTQIKQIGNANLKALSEQFKTVGDKMMSAGKTLSTYVTAPLVAVGTMGAKKFAEVDKTMQLTNKTMGNTKSQADLLNKAMKNAAANSTFGMNDAATASLNFARAGLKAEQAASTLAPAMNLAAGEGGNLDTVSSGLVATINGFGDTFDNAADYADVFANACNNSALDVDSLSDAMSVAAPIFSSAGYNVKDAALYMGVMANNGIDAKKAATSLKTGLARLVAPSKQGAAAMKNLEISVTNADGTMKSTVQIQKELHDKFMDLSESERIAAASAIFGKNQMAPWLALIKTSPDEVKKLNTQLGVTGTTSEMAEAMMSGFGGSIEKLKSGLDVLATSLGEALAPAIQKVADWVNDLVNWFNKLSPKTQKVIAVVGLLAAALGPVLIVLGAIASGIGSIISLIGTVGPAIGGLAATGGPILLVVGVLAALVAAGVLLYKNWDKIKAAAKALGAKLKEIWTSIKTATVNAWNAIKTAIVDKVTGFITSAKAKIQAFKTSIKTTWESIKTTAKEKWTSIKEAILSPIETAKDKIKSKLEYLRDFIDGKWDRIKYLTEYYWGKIKDKLLSPIETAKEKITDIIDKIKDLFPINIKNLFSSIKLPHFSWTWQDVGGLISIPDIDVDWYDKGGIFRSPSVIGVGEKRPEFVGALDDLRKIVREESGAAVAPTINIYQQPGQNATDLALEVQRILVRLQNQRSKAYGNI